MSVAGVRIRITRRRQPGNHPREHFAGDLRITLWGDRSRHRNKQPPLSEESLWALGHPDGHHLRIRRCKVCNRRFIAHYTAKICSNACAKKNRKAWRAARRPPPKPPVPSRTAQRRAALAAATCRACGNPFAPQRLSARFCSNACRQKNYRLTFRPPPVAALTLFSDAKARTGRFAICDAAGRPLWFGRFFENDRGYDGSQWSGELSAAKKAVWLASKVKEAIEADTIELTLKVDAEWLTYGNNVASGDDGGGEARALGLTSKRLGVTLNIEWVRGVDNPADAFTVAKGYKSWRDNDLKALALRP